MLRTGKCWELLWFLHCYVDDIGEVGLAGATVLKQSREKTQTGWVSLKIIEQLFHNNMSNESEPLVGRVCIEDIIGLQQAGLLCWQAR